MEEMLFATMLWLVSHLGISSTPLRGILTRTIGEGPYLAMYSLIAVVTLGYLIWVYTQVPRFDYLWLPNPDLYWVAKLTMPVAFILLLGGFLVKNPTAVGMKFDDPSQAADLARGVTRITRHPFQWAIIIWGVGHIIANGDNVSVVFFSGFVVLSLMGSVLMDAKKAATMGEGWQAYAGVTSNVPFAAILSGRNRLNIKELLMPIAIGVVAYGLAYYFHEAFTGAIVI